MGEIIKVSMADLKVCKYPDSLTTLGLGSCVGVALYDKATRVTGLAHIMLPDSTAIKNNGNIAKFADTGIVETVRLMVALGASKSRIVAKIAGGANMFQTGTSDASHTLKVGANNVAACKKKLAELGIPIIAEDTGLNYGRTVVIRSEDGVFTIRAIGKPLKEI